METRFARYEQGVRFRQSEVQLGVMRVIAYDRLRWHSIHRGIVRDQGRDIRVNMYGVG